MTADVETGDVEHMTAVEVCLSATQQQQFLSMLRKLADDPDHKHLWVEMSEFLGVHYPCGVDGRSPVLSVASLINAICSREFDEVFDDIEGGPAKGEEPSQALDGEQADEGACWQFLCDIGSYDAADEAVARTTCSSEASRFIADLSAAMTDEMTWAFVMDLTAAMKDDTEQTEEDLTKELCTAEEKLTWCHVVDLAAAMQDETEEELTACFVAELNAAMNVGDESEEELTARFVEELTAAMTEDTEEDLTWRHVVELAAAMQDDAVDEIF